MNSKILTKSFYLEDAETLAPRLLGKILVRRTEGGIIRAAITETECYKGTDDTACHASRGKTARTSVMFEEGGRAYVYLCYGMHNMLNIVTGAQGEPQAVLIRSLAKVQGPGRLTKAMDITRELNGEILYESDRLWLEDGESLEYMQTPRIGIDYADKKDRERLWRYIAK
ncbi:MAG: DNA-3-methyladenine glycosylase [Candidatus Avispirillum sp.]